MNEPNHNACLRGNLKRKVGGEEVVDYLVTLGPLEIETSTNKPSSRVKRLKLYLTSPERKAKKVKAKAEKARKAEEAKSKKVAENAEAKAEVHTGRKKRRKGKKLL